jgi:CubicO group peptidase (beta-lactamase class C family)
MTGRNIGRRQAVIGSGAAVMTTAALARAMATDGDMAAHLAEMEKDGRVFGLHALLVSRGGRLVFEHYGAGVDEFWGEPLGNVTFGPTVLHDLRSVSKSIVGMLYGIALADGKVPPPEAKLYDQFPQYPDLASQPGRDQITIAHVLSMTLGIEWDELTLPYPDPRNSEIAMESAPDRYRYALSCPIIGPPGVKWTYCGGATALLGHLIARGTGQKLHHYARRVLFDPLGLGPTDISMARDGEPRAASGLRIRPADLLRVGQMVLAGGVWQGRQIVPAKWLEQSTTRSVVIDGPFGYGWHWYLLSPPDGAGRTIGAAGWGGQRLYVMPAADLVVAINCGNYWKSGADQRRVTDVLLKELVLPAVM